MYLSTWVLSYFVPTISFAEVFGKCKKQERQRGQNVKVSHRFTENLKLTSNHLNHLSSGPSENKHRKYSLGFPHREVFLKSISGKLQENHTSCLDTTSFSLQYGIGNRGKERVSPAAFQTLSTEIISNTYPQAQPRDYFLCFFLRWILLHICFLESYRRPVLLALV